MVTTRSATSLPRLFLQETSTSGIPTATYVLSSPSPASDDSANNGRIDIIPPNSESRPTITSANTSTNAAPSLLIRLLTPLLPTNYPHSVSPDYTPYQIYDSLQAFTSTIASLLASRAVLTTLGVGKEDASSATFATLLSIVQESIGRFATIFFAHHFALRIEAEVKFYRFLADVVNDAAFVLDVLSPSLPTAMRVPALCAASACRAICGVCGGSSKAILSAHFARAGNIGELNAKDGSQETVVSLVGMWVGGVVVSRVEGRTATWVWLLTLLGCHLWANWMAVRSVRLRTLNRGRARMVMERVIGGGKDVGVEEIGKEESLWERTSGFVADGVRWRLEFGGIQELLAMMGWQKREKSFGGDESAMRELLNVFNQEKYLLWYDGGNREVLVVLREGANARTQLVSWYHAMVLADRYPTYPETMGVDATMKTIERTLPLSHAGWNETEELLIEKGWQVASSSLEVPSGARLQVQTG